MTPEQLDHLRRIDAHLERLLELASKRTPGEWYESQHRTAVYGRRNRSEQIAYTGFANGDAAFIASCAGNAEAGWKATRAAIAEILSAHQARYESWCLVCQELNQNPGKLEDYALPPWSESILAAFPLESLKL